MRENTLNEDEIAEIVDDQISVLTTTPYMIVRGEMNGREINIIAVDNEDLIYPLFIMPTTELIACIMDPETGNPLFKLQGMN